VESNGFPINEQILSINLPAYWIRFDNNWIVFQVARRKGRTGIE
jgi:hypothetical protein